MSAVRHLEHEALNEVYFLVISLILAFGLLQTAGTALDTDKPVVSVVSCSMYPQLHVGDIIVVQGEPFEDIEVDDVAVFSVKQADISVGDEAYELSHHRDPVQTDIGEIQIVEVFANREGEAVQAILDVDGERIRVSQESVHSVNGETLTVEQLRGMEIPIVHRVTDKQEDFLQTQGDNNAEQLSFESRIEPEQIHGTSVFIIPRIGGLKLLAMDIVGFEEGSQPFVIDSYPQCQIRS